MVCFPLTYGIWFRSSMSRLRASIGQFCGSKGQGKVQVS